MMSTITRMAPMALALVLAVPPTAGAATFKIDDSHTRVGFKARHMMVSWVQGDFTEFDGSVDFDPDDLESFAVDVTIAIDSIDTRNEKRDKHLRSSDFFSAKKYPEMTFVSTEVRDVTDDGFDLVGDLTLRGVTNEVVLHVSGPTPPMRNPMGVVVYGFHAETTIDRTAWGVDWNMPIKGGVVVSEEVVITIDMELMKK